MSKATIMDVFSDFQTYIDEDQDIREVIVIFIVTFGVS